MHTVVKNILSKQIKKLKTLNQQLNKDKVIIYNIYIYIVYK